MAAASFGTLQQFEVQGWPRVAAYLVMTALAILVTLVEYRRAFAGRWVAVAILFICMAAVTLLAIFSDRQTAAEAEVPAKDAREDEAVDTAALTELHGWERVVSDDGSMPVSSSSIDGIGPVLLGMPQRTVEAIFGPPDQQYGIEDLHIQWNNPDGLNDSHLTVSFAASGGTAQSIFLVLSDADVRVALPYNLVLGYSTFSDVLNELGDPVRIVRWTAENTVFYSIYYRGGPEGTIWYEYSWSSDYGVYTDPGWDELKNLRATGYGLSFDAPTDDEMGEVFDSWPEQESG